MASHIAHLVIYPAKQFNDKVFGGHGRGSGGKAFLVKYLPLYLLPMASLNQLAPKVNIFFPMGKDSRDSIDHDIWILNEEYHYFEHIASDKPLASIPWKDNENLFENDIDESLEALFAKNNKENQLKRPDIAIFNQEGSAIIIEFKAPGVELQEHIPDLVQYARLLAAKSNGKIKKFYGYLIGDCMDETRMPPSYTRFPSGLGYFNTDHIRDQSTGIAYGELYSEILFYSQFIDRAKNRLKVYKDKLNVDI